MDGSHNRNSTSGTHDRVQVGGGMSVHNNTYHDPDYAEFYSGASEPDTTIKRVMFWFDTNTNKLKVYAPGSVVITP